MARTGGTTRVATWIAIGGIAMMVGCAQFRLPAIDPSGQRIFLPAPNSTTLAVHDRGGHGAVRLPRAPQPAFTTPAQPPPCPLPLEAPSPLSGACCPAPAAAGIAGHSKHAGHHGHDLLHPARQAQVVLMPKRVVAPVGGEVVLVSGLRGTQGKMVKGQPLEWVLSQESVGHFLQVGQPPHSMLKPFDGERAKLLSASFARSQTSHKKRLVTRGTSSAADDVTLDAGQSYVTVTSPSEGVSHVTVMATNAEVWDQRRETATIYWVDARWDLPAPVALRAGERHVLTTRVTRNAAGIPAEGWIVRYELAPGSSASFLPSGEPVAEAVVDASGTASVEIQTAAEGTDSARIRVQIMRPADGASGLPQMVVGQGWTSVTWNAPGLLLRVFGPTSARPGEVLTYQVQVSNPGTLVTRGVVVADAPPAGLVVLNSSPPFEQFGDRHQWPLGDLGPGQTRQIVLQCRLELDRTVRYTFRAESADGLAAEQFVDTVVVRPTLSLELRGPERAMVGEQVTYEARVRNTSGRDLAEVIVTDTYDPGLQQSEGAASPIRRSLGPLRADEEKAFAVSFLVRQPGTWCHVLEARAPDGFTAQSRACLQATAPAPAPRPAIDVEISGPGQLVVGQLGLYSAQVTNTGNVPLTQVQIVLSPDASLQPRQASGEYQRDENRFVWQIGTLQPGEGAVRQLNCLGLAPADGAVVRADVAALENVSDAAAVQTRIVPPQAAPQPFIPQPGPAQPAVPQPGPAQPAVPRTVPGRPVGPVPQPAEPPAGTRDPSRPLEARIEGGPLAPNGVGSGRLSVTVADSRDPIPMGETTTYLVVITNERQVADSNVVLTIRLPEGMELARLAGPVAARASGDGGRTIEMTPIQTLRAGERLRPFQIEVRGLQAGERTLRVDVRSQREPRGVSATESTTVLAP